MTQYMSQSMTREAALRIGLAARELNGMGVSGLVLALAGKLGLPLTEGKLATLTVAELRLVLLGDDSPAAISFNEENLNQAVQLMWGNNVPGSDLPPLDAYREGDMPQAIRVACASNSEENIDGHFGSCERFLIYQVSVDELRLLAVRPTLEAEQAEDRNVARANLIADCQVVYVQSIGGPAAAKVVRAGVHPVKIQRSTPAREIMARLQETLHKPPPWLAKAMGVKAPSLEKFAESYEDSLENSLEES